MAVGTSYVAVREVESISFVKSSSYRPVVPSSRRPVVPACVMRQSASITGVLTRGHPQSTKMSKRAYVIDGDLKAIEEVYKEAAKLEWSEEREAFKKALL